MSFVERRARRVGDKFCSEGGAFTMAFSGLSTFYGGLEVQAPEPRSCART